jgi:hypothetical protein
VNEGAQARKYGQRHHAIQPKEKEPRRRSPAALLISRFASRAYCLLKTSVESAGPPQKLSLSADGKVLTAAPQPPVSPPTAAAGAS